MSDDVILEPTDLEGKYLTFNLMEEYYGVSLFERKPNIQLTYAGELLEKYIHELNQHEKKLLAEFSNISLEKKGKIRVGITPTRAPIFFPTIFSRFNELHPYIELSLREDHTTILLNDLMNGKIDFLIGLEDAIQNQAIKSITLLQDREMFFLVSEKLLIKSDFNTGQILEFESSGVSFNDIKYIPIVLNHHGSNIHSQILQKYLAHRHKPRIVVESSNLLPLLSLCVSGNVGMFMSKTILHYVNANHSDILKNVYVFVLNDLAVNADISLMYFYDKQILSYHDEFINVTKSVFSEYKI